jgi:hypothetical protein
LKYDDRTLIEASLSIQFHDVLCSEVTVSLLEAACFVTPNVMWPELAVDHRLAQSAGQVRANRLPFPLGVPPQTLPSEGSCGALGGPKIPA